MRLDERYKFVGPKIGFELIKSQKSYFFCKK